MQRSLHYAVDCAIQVRNARSISGLDEGSKMIHAPKSDPVSARHMEHIAYNRQALVRSYASLIESLDASDAGNWRTIIGAAREAGLSKEELCLSFSCAWTTILRWEAGRNAPGPFARNAMKAKLLEMLDRLYHAEGERLHALQIATAVAAA
jgi:ribosome-binding protein aMBF1 (putative translation factor)